MFVRETISKRKHGADVTYLHLAHNVWDAEEKKAHTKILHSFGRKDQLDVAAVKRLVKSLAAYLPHDQQFDLFSPGLTFPWCRPFGAVYAVDQLWRRFGLQQFFHHHLKARSFQMPVERALFAMVAQRALAPASKLSLIEQWIKEEVLIPGGSDLQVQHLYRALDFLALHLKEVEGALYHQLVDLFSLDVSLIFFDTTSVYFETDEDTDGLRRFGYSKDHRPDRPQIVVAVAINRDGYPLRHWVLPGNTADVTLTRQVAADLHALRPRRFVFVGDRGMVSQKNLDFLESRQLGYILGVRARSDPLAEAVLSKRGRFRPVTENLQVKEAIVWKEARKLRYLLCYNPGEAARDKARREETLEALEAELASSPRSEKGRAQLLASRRFGRYLTVTSRGTLRVNRGKVREEARLDGKYLLQTNEFSLSAAQVATSYRDLYLIERTFRTFKHVLDIRPVYHTRERRIRAHVGLCVLAYLLTHHAERACDTSWNRIKSSLSSLHAGCLSSSQGTFIKTTVPTSEQRTFFKKLKVKQPPEILTNTVSPPSA